ncbi:acyl-CoA dehydrogenase FadE [Streptococcus iniae]|uniref:acyl-CoA dehydrogenase FadE n=1 Tax=Streptococcus iniae TaxID=1346 RepID=UPI002B2EA9AE|nr:acyl-CoA dehydrogenase family protein [Streptococcus iniae]WNZ97712.1 acyl-CoA dehydrogenase family protein [Streptococcus iniae]
MSTKQEMLKELYPEDVMGYSQELTEGEVKKLAQIRELLETKYRPLVNDCWMNAEVPEGFFQDMGKMNYLNDPLLFEGRPGAKRRSEMYFAFMCYELSRFDISMNTFIGVHIGLGHNTFLFGGSEEQVNYYVPKLQSHELMTCFALTEPEHGSDVAGGLATTAKFDGENWVINGEKRWIGGGAVADVVPVFARDLDTNDVKCFIVEKGQEGFTADVIENKIALRIVPNANLHFKDVKVPESKRLQKINGFKDVAKILYSTRAGVVAMAAGGMGGALQATLKYVTQRKQFGKEISQYQLIQEKLAVMQANTMSGLGYATQLARMQESGQYSEIATSMAKMFNATRLRETVALGRGVCGGNGITVDYDIARFFCDAEAIYTYEGTHEINALVIGRALTGKQAFI